jgi:hypothetical protein
LKNIQIKHFNIPFVNSIGILSFSYNTQTLN